MRGTFVAVVGPSGVGKDSLISFAREQLSENDRVTFVRRVITRQADEGAEDHESLDTDAFAAAEQNGAFAIAWDAHGLRYGLPISLEADLEAGKVVVANISRRMVPAVVQHFPCARVVLVTADRATIAQRLASRGRETSEAIERRLQRRVDHDLPDDTVYLDNSGALHIAGNQFSRLLADAAAGLVAKA